MRILTACLGGLAAFVATTALAAGIADVEFHGFGEPERPLTAEQRAGLDAILSARNFSYGVPVALYRKVIRDEGLTVEKLFRDYGSFPSPPSRGMTEGVPLPLDQTLATADDGRTRYVNQNCFTCHSGVVAGKVVAGMGNAHHEGVAFRKTAETLLSTWDSFVGRLGLTATVGRDGMKVLEGYTEFLRTILVPSIRTVKARGDIHGPFVIWRSIARMADPAQGFDMTPPGVRAPLEELLAGVYPTVDPNPWWHMRHKSRTFWLYDTSRDSLATFALNLMDPHPHNTQTFPDRMEMTRDQLAFAAGTTPPAYPEAIDREQAAAGYRLFHAVDPLEDGVTRLRCAGCHGSYAEDGAIIRYADPGVIPLAVVGTDAAYASWLHDKLEPLYEHFEKSPHVLKGPDAPGYPEVAGYVPPPLTGVWASAPYFHNGAAPTLTAVLDSKARPKLWRRSLDPFAYDHERGGLVHELVDESTYRSMTRRAEQERDPMGPANKALRQVYDTTAYGKNNGGHTFGDAMSADERKAVVEYLKTLR